VCRRGEGSRLAPSGPSFPICRCAGLGVWRGRGIRGGRTMGPGGESFVHAAPRQTPLSLDRNPIVKCVRGRAHHSIHVSGVPLRGVSEAGGLRSTRAGMTPRLIGGARSRPMRRTVEALAGASAIRGIAPTLDEGLTAGIPVPESQASRPRRTGRSRRRSTDTFGFRRSSGRVRSVHRWHRR
jgi:hypothetical protein